MIQKLSIRNFLGIKQVEITPDGKLNVITGTNGSGKTSILKAIEAAFKGRIGKDVKTVHIGEDKAEILVELDNMVIEKTITNSGNKTKITKDGMVVPKPQDFLDGIIGDFSFNPIEFANLKESQKTEYLLKLLNINITQSEIEQILGVKLEKQFDSIGLKLIDEVHSYLYEKRKEVNLQRTTLDKYINESLDKLVVVNFNENEYNNIVQEKNELYNAKQQQSVNRTNHQHKLQKLDNINQQIEELKKKLALLEDEKTGLTVEIQNFADDITDYESKLNEIDALLNVMIEQKSKFEQRKSIENESTKLHELTAKHKRLDELTNMCATGIREKIMREAKLPINGLSYVDGNFLIDGKNFDNLSGRERLVVSLQIAKSLNKDFKIICIDGAEALDKEAFEELKNEINKEEYQYFITNVHSDGNIVMKNGNNIDNTI